MREVLLQIGSVGGAIAAAAAASACCVGPLVLALLGLGGAGALVALEPFRPVLTLLTLVLLGGGWAIVLGPTRPSAADADHCGCEQPRTNRAGRRLLFVATLVVGLLLVFPFVTPLLF